ncbi:hypothetical protein [Hymenobacter seoulensis]
MNTIFLLLSIVSTGLITTGCKDQNKPKYRVKPSYNFTLKATLSDGGGESGCGTNTEYRLAQKDRWIKAYSRKYFFESGNPEAVMYIYRFRTHFGYDSKSGRCKVVSGDTLMSDVTEHQADSLLVLGKAVFKNVVVSNLDTVYDGPAKYFSIVFHDAGGQLNSRTVLLTSRCIQAG